MKRASALYFQIPLLIKEKKDGLGTQACSIKDLRVTYSSGVYEVRQTALLRRIISCPRNARFADLVTLARAFGFVLDRIKGSHHIFKHPNIPELLNFQEVDGKGKPYQIRQFLDLVERYRLTLGEETKA